MADAIRIAKRHPDRIAVEDAGLADFLGALLNEPGGAMASPWIAVRDLPKLESRLRAWSGELPEWWLPTVEEARWAGAHSWRQESVAWLAGGDRMVIQAPYALTLADAIGSLDSPYYFSAPLRGWVVHFRDPDAETIDELLLAYDITTSRGLRDHIDGRGDWQANLNDTVAEAEAAGFRPRTEFPSGRAYKPWQRQAVLAMALQQSTVLADQVGLGKGGSFTGGLLTAIDHANAANEEVPLPVVISVTKSMKDEIAEEVTRWWGGVRVQILSGTKRDPLEPGMDVYLLNHDILERRLPDLLEVEPRAFIADEAHVFKNEDAKRTQGAQALAAAIRRNCDNPYIVLASGTPFLNGPLELWSPLKILDLHARFGDYARKKLGYTKVKVKTMHGWKNVNLSDKRAFEIYFCNGHYDRFGAWQNFGSSHVTELNRLLIATGMIRRRKSDVMHPLPDLRERLNPIELDRYWADEYKRVEAEFQDWALGEAARKAAEEGISERQALRTMMMKLEGGNEAIMRLTALRITLAKAKIDGTVEWIRSFMEGSLVVEHNDGHEGPVSDDPDRRKLIVFAHHKEPRMELVEHPELQQYGLVTILSGDEQDGASIQEAKRKFQQDDRYRLMICSFAAREGHTLTAAKDVYLHEIPFAPSWVVQCAGRAWARLSEEYEPHEATLTYATVAGSEDARSLQRIRIKKAIMDAVVDGEGQDETINDLRDEGTEGLLEGIHARQRELLVAGERQRKSPAEQDLEAVAS